MDLQSLFYLVSIIFITGWLLLLLIIIVGVLIGVRGVKRVTAKIEEKMESHNAGVLISLIPAVSLVLTELKKWAERKGSDSDK